MSFTLIGAVRQPDFKGLRLKFFFFFGRTTVGSSFRVTSRSPRSVRCRRGFTSWTVLDPQEKLFHLQCRVNGTITEQPVHWINQRSEEPRIRSQESGITWNQKNGAARVTEVGHRDSGAIPANHRCCTIMNQHDGVGFLLLAPAARSRAWRSRSISAVAASRGAEC